jgi:hypothetical protein
MHGPVIVKFENCVKMLYKMSCKVVTKTLETCQILHYFRMYEKIKFWNWQPYKIY